MTVITISREFGSGGDEIAYRVSQELGLTLFHPFMVLKEMKEAGLPKGQWLDLCEEKFELQSFLAWILSGSFNENFATYSEEEKARVLRGEMTRLEIDSMRELRKMILTVYQSGNFVILGRGAQVVLKDKPGVLHVRIISPEEVRVMRIRNQINAIYPGSEWIDACQQELQAWDLLRERDAAFKRFNERYFHICGDEAEYYDLMIDTGLVNTHQAVEKITRFAHEMEVKQTKGGKIRIYGEQTVRKFEG